MKSYCILLFFKIVFTGLSFPIQAWTRSERKDGGVGTLKIPLVADISKRISASYGVLVTDEDDEMYGAALRGLFLIGNRTYFFDIFDLHVC